MSNYMLFGNYENMQTIRAFLSPLATGSDGYSAQSDFLDGGASVVASGALHRQFDIEVSGTADDVGLIKDYYSGVYGNGLCYFTLSSARRRNLFNPSWAAPRLIQSGGWPELMQGNTATFSATTANTYLVPPVSATYSFTNASANLVPTWASKRFFIPIEVGKTLNLGWMGSATGTGVVAYRTVTAGYVPAFGAVTALTPLSVTASTRTNATIVGSSSIQGVEVFITATSTAASTVTIAALMAQIGSSAITGVWLPGRGFSGVQFTGGVEESITIDADGFEVMRANSTLVEVQLWQRF